MEQRGLEAGGIISYTHGSGRMRIDEWNCRKFNSTC